MGTKLPEESHMLNLVAASLFGAVGNFLFYQALPFLVLLGFCVTIHEFGHFLFAKIFRIPVEKFSIGFGPALFRKKIGETDFRIAYLPLGGYVKMRGEDEGEVRKALAQKELNVLAGKEPEETPITTEKGFDFYEAPIYRRILVVFGGPLFNIISAFFLIVASLSIFGLAIDPYTKIQVEDNGLAKAAGLQSGDSIIAVNGVQVKSWDDVLDILLANIDTQVNVTVSRENKELTKQLFVKPDSLGLTNLVPPILATIKRDGPADKAGMKHGDRVLRIDGLEINTWYELYDIVSNSRGKNLYFEWQHGDELKAASITPAPFYNPVLDDTVGQVGVFKPHSREYLSLAQASISAFERTTLLIIETIKIFYGLVVRKIPTSALGGPIAIFRLSAESAKWGIEYLISLLILISVNLGLINLFPLPAFDGGHIIVGLIEAVRGKRFSRNARLVIQQIGYAIILLLIIFVTFNDITR